MRKDSWPEVMPERVIGVPQQALTNDAMLGNYEILLMDYVKLIIGDGYNTI